MEGNNMRENNNENVKLEKCEFHREGLAGGQSIHCIHAPISFSVSETLEFYDCNSSKTLPSHTTIYWTDWVKSIGNTLVSAISKSILEEESC